jgi:DNA polymerase-3 subunit alpha
VPNSFVYVKAFVKEGWVNRDTGKKGDPRIQFNNFEMLHDVMDRYAKKLTISFLLNDLKDDRIDSLKDILKQHKGDHILNFMVYEPQEEIKLQMPSRKQKVKISQELIEQLVSNNIQYKLN